MTKQYVNEWELGLGLDIKPLEKKAKRVEKIIGDLSKVNFTAAKTYQNMLNAQLSTLKKQEAIVRRIRGSPAAGAAPPRPMGTPPPRAPSSSLSTRRSFEANRYGIQADVDRLESGLGDRLGKDSNKLRDIQMRISQINRGLKKATDVPGLRKLRVDLRHATSEAKRYERQINNIARAEKRGSMVRNGFSSSLKNLVRGYASVYLAMRGIGAAYRAVKELSSIKATLLAASGGAVQAAEDFEFLRRTSIKLGTDLMSSAKGYAQLGVAAREAGMETAQMKEIFIATAEAATSFQMSGDDAYGMVRSLVQMLSKGTVMNEELRTQMGDRMPIAVSIMAKAVGVSNGELMKMMEKGELASNKVLPNFAKGLREAAREGGALASAMKSVQAEENRVNTALTSLAEAFGKGGGEEGITDVLRMFSSAIADLGPFIEGFGALFKWLVKPLSIFSSLVLKVVIPPLNLLGSLLSETGRYLDIMFGKFDTGTEKLSKFERGIRMIGKGLQTLMAPLVVFIEALDVLNDTASKQGYLSTIWNVGVGTKKGKELESQMDAEMVSRLRGTTSPTSSISNSNSSMANNVNVQYNITGADAKNIKAEVEDGMQGVFKLMAPAIY